MEALTLQQQNIINSLTNEFLALNVQPIKKGGLIDVGLINKEVEELTKWKASCDAEVRAYKRAVHFQIVADIEKIKSDLALLGLKIKGFDPKHCRSSIIIEGKDNAFCIHYDSEDTIIRYCQREERRIPRGTKIRVEFGSYKYSGVAIFSNIELLCAHPNFRNVLKELINQ